MIKLAEASGDLLDIDFFFMSYDEKYATKGYNKLLKIVPDAKRIHGIKGIANAWKAAADLCDKDYFITMDADTELLPSFSFTIPEFVDGDERIHVWRSLNAVNGLIYGHGSIHMFPKKLVQEFTNTDVVDFTLSVGTKGFNIQEECATVTKFNRDPYLTWRSAFREASKLASQTNMYVGTSKEWLNNDPISMHRLFVWCSVGRDTPYGNYSILGARQGAFHGFRYKNNPKKLSQIADYDTFKEISYDDCSQKLKKYGLYVVDFTAEQSQELKKHLCNINNDVIERLKYKNSLLS